MAFLDALYQGEEVSNSSADWAGYQRGDRVAVIGAGIAGLAVALELQRAAKEVFVLERSISGAGASEGNAGWVTPGLAVPLADPSVFRYGAGVLWDPSSPLSISPRPNVDLARFLVGFSMRANWRSWASTYSKLLPVNQMAIACYDELDALLGTGIVKRNSLRALFVSASAGDALTKELELVVRHGGDIRWQCISSEDLRSAIPYASESVLGGVEILDQRSVDPTTLLSSLRTHLQELGVHFIEGIEVRRVTHSGGALLVGGPGAPPIRVDDVVIATGALLPELSRMHGVRTKLQAGRGYSFSVEVQDSGKALSPTYFPHERVVATPLDDGTLRVGGMMEFERPDRPVNVQRLVALRRTARRLLNGVNLEDGPFLRPWVGSRPVTVDGLPLVGPTRTPGIWVHGGHGMWGMCQGPATGRLLAEYIVTGERPAALAGFDPLR